MILLATINFANYFLPINFTQTFSKLIKVWKNRLHGSRKECFRQYPSQFCWRSDEGGETLYLDMRVIS